jgi:hypothetical protein
MHARPTQHPSGRQAAHEAEHEIPGREAQLAALLLAQHGVHLVALDLDRVANDDELFGRADPALDRGLERGLGDDGDAIARRGAPALETLVERAHDERL